MGRHWRQILPMLLDRRTRGGCACCLGSLQSPARRAPRRVQEYGSDSGLPCPRMPGGGGFELIGLLR
eukprot:8405428-Alexandrium_andersonii.AAC.1